MINDIHIYLSVVQNKKALKEHLKNNENMLKQSHVTPANIIIQLLTNFIRRFSLL